MTASLRRLRKRPEFLQVARARRSWVTPGFILQACRHGDAEGCDVTPQERRDTIGIGFTASRKVGTAVARNRARRRLRALAREILPAAGTPGTDYVLIARAGTLSRTYMEMAADLKSAISRLNAANRRGQQAARRECKDKGRA